MIFRKEESVQHAVDLLAPNAGPRVAAHLASQGRGPYGILPLQDTGFPQSPSQLLNSSQARPCLLLSRLTSDGAFSGCLPLSRPFCLHSASGLSTLYSFTPHSPSGVKKSSFFLFPSSGSFLAKIFSIHSKESLLSHLTPQPSPYLLSPQPHPQAGRCRAVVHAEGAKPKAQEGEERMNTHQVQSVGFLRLPLPALLGSNAIFLPPLNFPHIIR